jgi:hypothetical protein
VRVEVAHAHVVVREREEGEHFLEVLVGAGEVVDGRSKGGCERFALARDGLALETEPCRVRVA